MKIINKKLRPKAFVDYLNELEFDRKIDKLVFHHTSSPVEIWEGSKSMLHYWNLYRSRGWTVGPHIFIAPDGIWLFTDMRKQGKHAGPQGNRRSIGIEIVGRYYDAPPKEEEICKNVAVVLQALLNKFYLQGDAIRHHTQYHPEGFCSPQLTREWLIKNRDKYSKYLKEILL